MTAFQDEYECNNLHNSDLPVETGNPDAAWTSDRPVISLSCADPPLEHTE